MTGTVTDSNGIPYSNARLTVTLSIPGATVQVTNQQTCSSGGFGSQPCYIPFSTTIGPIALDNTGSFALALYSNAGIYNLQGGVVTTQWNFNVTLSPGILLPFGTGAQQFSSPITIAGASQSVSATLTAAAPLLTNSGISLSTRLNSVTSPTASSNVAMGANTWTQSGTGGGSFTPFGFPVMHLYDCTGCTLASDHAPVCFIDSLAPSTNPYFCIVMKSNGQIELLAANNFSGSLGMDLEVTSAGAAELTLAANGQIDTTANGNIVLLPGGGPGGTGGGTVSMKNFQAGPFIAQGTGATVSAIGPCATPVGTSYVGFEGFIFDCSGATGAETLTITPPGGGLTPPITTALQCYGYDTTAGVAGVQQGVSTSTCKLHWASITSTDNVIFYWTGW